MSKRTKNTNEIPDALSPYMGKYCYACGLPLVFKKKWQDGYDSDTGKAEFIYRFTCPKYAWWTLFTSWKLHESHTYKVCTPTPLWTKDEKGKTIMHTTVLERFPY